MSDESISRQIQALRIEAEESRQLANNLTDKQAILDLENYAFELEAGAAKQESQQDFSSNMRRRPKLDRGLEIAGEDGTGRA